MSEVKGGKTVSSLWHWKDVGSTHEANEDLASIMGKGVFPNPKNKRLIQRIIQTANLPANGIILDSFAGSGTTAQAVLNLNKQDGGNRKFILVECEDKYVETVTTERVRRVIRGVPDTKNESLREGTGGSFTYCTLGEPIDIEDMLSGKSLPDYSTLASHLLYVAAGTATTKQLRPKRDGLFWSGKDTDYYLLYKPNIEYLQSVESTLTVQQARKIYTKNRHAVVFAADKEMSVRELSKFNIEFCRLPDAISGSV